MFRVWVCLFHTPGAKNVDIFVSADSSWSPSHRINAAPTRIFARFLCVRDVIDGRVGVPSLARGWMGCVCVCVYGVSSRCVGVWSSVYGVFFVGEAARLDARE